MADYVQYTIGDENSVILVEVEEGEISDKQGVQKASSIFKRAGDTISSARISFEDSLKQMLHYNAHAFIQSVSQLPILPEEAEFTFGLKATAEGGMAVAKVTGEANYAIRLTWKRESKPQQGGKEIQTI